MTAAIRIPDVPDPDLQVMERAYQKWAPIYDALCGPIFLTGRRAAAAAARQVGGRILEIGVGTGLSFDDYDHTTEITGIDISEPMIMRAHERLASGKYPFVEALHVMDAAALSFNDQSFDCVVAQFVITLVANPEQVLSECARAQARRADHSGQSPLFGARYRRRNRARHGETCTAPRLAAGVSIRAA